MKLGIFTAFISVMTFLRCMSSEAVLAQVSGDPLDAICKGFLSSSGLPAPGDTNTLCSCLVREVQANLSASEMLAYQNATNANQSLPLGVENKITAIAVKCLTESN